MADWRISFHDLLEMYNIPPLCVYNGDQTGVVLPKATEPDVCEHGYQEDVRWCQVDERQDMYHFDGVYYCGRG